MPLVERYNDWMINNRSFDDPHTLELDHRVEADEACPEAGLTNIEDNVGATCVITVLKPEFGWSRVGEDWSYDPTHKRTDLSSIWRDKLPACVQHDRDNLKSCFCDPVANPATAYVGPEAERLRDKIDKLEWPKVTTEFVSRFDLASQYMIGQKFASAYHLGDGYVATAGHILDKALITNRLGELRVVFNWVGDVKEKKTFTEAEVFGIERLILCDTHGPAPDPADAAEIRRWSGRWDSAIFKMKGSPRQFSELKSAKYATRPPAFGSPVYSVGSPIGTQLKVSASAQVLRHSLAVDDGNPFSHRIAGRGTFTTDLDQFEGNSGGPVFDATTGYVVGHTSSTQNAVAESEANDIQSWAEEYATQSNNYALAADMNRLLEKQEPDNRFYRIHPKFLRTLSGKPDDSPLISSATNVCPGDIGPNKVIQAPGKDQAVSSRHAFNTKDVFLRNVTARVDRSAIFMTSLNVLINDFDNVTLTVMLGGQAGAFQKPDANSTFSITSNATAWNIHGPRLREDTGSKIPSGTEVWSATLNLTAIKDTIPAIFLDAARGLIAWTDVRLEQPAQNPPLMVGLNLAVRRNRLPFPVNRSWPPDRPDVTDDPADEGLEWPEETFEFVTTAGEMTGVFQKRGWENSECEFGDESGRWVWKVPLDRVWTNPRQGSQGLRDRLLDNVDEGDLVSVKE